MGVTLTKLFSWLFGKKEIEIVMVGLDFSGKTTILQKLKLGEIVQTIPTVGINVENVQYKNINFFIVELGGQSIRMQPFWRDYFFKRQAQNYLIKRQALIYVVDSNDRNRIKEARDDLHKMFDEEEALTGVSLLVVANKRDLPNAMNADEITDHLALKSLRDHLWYVQSTCAISGEGVYEGLDWLYNNLDNKNN